MNTLQEIFNSVFPASRDAAVLTVAIGILLLAFRRLPRLPGGTRSGYSSLSDCCFRCFRKVRSPGEIGWR
jgi:hypothetical protein